MNLVFFSGVYARVKGMHLHPRRLELYAWVLEGTRNGFGGGDQNAVLP